MIDFEPGPNRVKIEVQGYLTGTQQKVVCGRLLDAGTVTIDRGYDEIIIICEKKNLMSVPGGNGFVLAQDIIGIGRTNGER